MKTKTCCLRLVALILTMIVIFVAVSLSACTSNHYFSINADEMTNPNIQYHDSTSVTNPF